MKRRSQKNIMIEAISVVSFPSLASSSVLLSLFSKKTTTKVKNKGLRQVPRFASYWPWPWDGSLTKLSRQDSWTKSTRNSTNEHEWQFERFVILWKVNWSTCHERGRKKKTSRTLGGRSIHWARRTRGKQRHLSEFICDRRLAYCKDQHCQWPCSLWVLVAQWIEQPPGVREVMRWIPVGGDSCTMLKARPKPILHKIRKTVITLQGLL